MTKWDREFDQYVALSPQKRMRARLQGLSEVISAAELDVLSEADLQRVAPGAKEDATEPRLSAFGETAAVFVGGVDKDAAPVTLDGPEQVALAERLGMSLEDLRTAIKEAREKP